MTVIHDVQKLWQVDILEDDLRSAEVVYFDFETTNDGPAKDAHEDWHPHSRITTAAFTTRPGVSYTVPLSHPEGPWSDHEHGGPRRDGGWIDLLTRLLEAMKHAKVAGHNGKFDVRWAHSMTGVDLVDRFWWCSMTAHYVVDENEPKDLETLAKLYLDVDDWKHTQIDSRRTEEYPWELVAEYASKDTDYGFQLLPIQRELLMEEPIFGRIFSKLMMPVTRALIRMERNGMLTNESYIRERLLESEEQILEVEDHLLEHYVSEALKEEFCWKRYKTKEDKPIRPSWSPNSKFFHAFMADVGAPVIERTKKTGKPSYNEGAMKRIASTGEYPYIDEMLRARKLGKDVGYLKSWLAKADEDGYLHPTFKPAHVATGRLSGENPNPQQISRHLKGCFPAPPGWWHVEADYAQVELRIAAMLAHETNMLEAFRQGKDLHRIMAAQIAGIEPHQVTKEQRQAAKAVNFGFLYGMGARKFVEYAFDEYGIIYTLDEAKRIRRLYFQTWPRLAEWHEEQRLTAHTQGYVRTPLGRRRRLPDLRHELNGKVAEAERQAINAPVQSFASDMMLLALIELDKRPSPHRKGVGTVHDSGIYYIEKGHLKAELAAIGDAMLHPPVKRLFGCEITVPLEVEFEVRQSWGDDPQHVITVSTNPQPLLDVEGSAA